MFSKQQKILKWPLFIALKTNRTNKLLHNIFNFSSQQIKSRNEWQWSAEFQWSRPIRISWSIWGRLRHLLLNRGRWATSGGSPWEQCRVLAWIPLWQDRLLVQWCKPSGHTHTTIAATTIHQIIICKLRLFFYDSLHEMKFGAVTSIWQPVKLLNITSLNPHEHSILLKF